MRIGTPTRTLVDTQVPGAVRRRRAIPEETAVALVYNGSTLAVMMATPSDLADFATGFALTEGVAGFAEMSDVELVEHAHGIEARIWLPEHRADALAARRRSTVGPVGCGLCGIDSLEQAARAVPCVESGLTMSATEVALALDELRDWQPLHDETRAVHAAGFWCPGAGIVMAREDVGRHNALDKLVGALARAGTDPATGAIVLTSRLSVEMVQKTAVAGAALLLSVSSPTAHAVRLAETAGITMVTHNRASTDIFTHPHRILEPSDAL